MDKHMNSIVARMLLSLTMLAYSAFFQIDAAFAEARPAHPVIPGAPYWYSGQTKDGWSWTKLSWAEDNSAYAAIRQKIEQQIAQSSDPPSVLAGYKLRAKADPTDPLAEFAYGYSAFLVSVDDSVDVNVRKLAVQDVPDYLANAKFPNTYDYARLRFLTESIVSGGSPLISVGFRLLNIHPNDRHVQYLCAQDLAYSGKKSNIESAIAYITGAMKQYPNDPVPYVKRAFMYMELQEIFGVQADKQKGIADYQAYVNMAPVTDTARSQIINLIRSLENS